METEFQNTRGTPLREGRPAPQAGAAEITALGTAEFGEVPAGKRIFVQASTMVDGFESLPGQFQARVPAAA